MKPMMLCVFVLALGFGQPESEPRMHGPWQDLDPGSLVMDDSDAGVHNVRVFYSDQSRTVLSGSLPEGDAGFDSLVKMGVKTILCVDAAKPDLERAEAHGMRYIHIPVKYSGISEEERTAIALALAQSEGTVYVHCHHGKHRGPAAAAIGLIGIGACTPENGRSLMEYAGTSENYIGLWEDVARAGVLTDAEMAKVAPMIVEYARIEGLPAIMAEMDRVYDHLAVLSKNEWQAPENHPDLSAQSEAGQLTDLFRTILADESLPVLDETYAQHMNAASKLSTLLEAQILQGMDREAVITIDQLKATCSACHKGYR